MFLSGQIIRTGEELAVALEERGFGEYEGVYWDAAQCVISTAPLDYGRKVSVDELTEELFHENLSPDGFGYKRIPGIICHETLEDGLVSYEPLE